MRLLLTALLLLVSCAPTTPTPTSPPATATPVATPTPAPGGYRLYVLPLALEHIDLLRAVCHARNSWYTVYDYGMTFEVDEAGEVACISNGHV